MLLRRGVQMILGDELRKCILVTFYSTTGKALLTHTAIWAGGLKASSLTSALGLQTGRGGRIDVQPDFTVKGLTGVYALGDFANIAGADGKPLPQLASVAQQAGKYCAENITADIAREPAEPFRYFDKGIVAMVGRNATAMDAPHPVEKANQNSPERDELKTPLGKMIVTGRWLVATRADCRRTLSWPDVHFDTFLAGAEAGLLVDESPMAMAVV